MHAGLFGALLDRLAARRTLYLVDLPGHGRSRDDASPLELESCVAAIAAQTPPAPWLGWSLGGLFALHAAVTRPMQANALIMLCSTPRFVRADEGRRCQNRRQGSALVQELESAQRGAR